MAEKVEGVAPMRLHAWHIAILIIFGLLVAWHLLVVLQSNEDDKAVERLSAHSNVFITRYSSPTPWAIMSGHDNQRGSVVTVNFSGHVTQEQIEIVATFKQCIYVDFHRVTYQDPIGIMTLSKMPKLRTLFFRFNSITNKMLIDCIPQMHHLRYLFIENNPIDDQCIDAIARVPKL